MEVVEKYASVLVKGLVKNSDFVKVQIFSDEDDIVILEIIVHNEDMASLIGKNGFIAKNVRTLIQACAYKNGIDKIKINIDSI